MTLSRQKIILLTITLLLYGFARPCAAQSLKIKIVETSDVHGAIFPYNFLEDAESKSSLAQVQTYLNQQRRLADQNILLFDNGDILQGTPAVYYYNYEKTDVPHLYAEVMNYMGYDVATIGNHDIEAGHPVYDKFKKEITFPWLAANAIDIDSDEPYFEPYYAFDLKGVKIAVLGLITPAIPQWLPPKIWSGMRFDDMVETAEKWVPIIREREHPDVMIGLFHAGLDYTYGGQTEDTPQNENASLLVAERVAGFDIIFVGHDHQGWNKSVKGPEGSEVLILGPRANARTLSVANIELNYNEQDKSWSKIISGESVDVDNFPPDNDFMEHFSAPLAEVKAYVSRPLAYLSKTISSKDALFGPSAFVDLIQNVQLELSGADISFSSPLSMTASIEEGEVLVRDMFKLYRYENLLYEIELTGREIKDYLEYSYAGWFNRMTNPDDNLLKFKHDQDGKIILSERTQAPALEERYYNFDSALGIDYIVNVSNDTGNRVDITGFSNGKPFVMNERYRVALNSYRGSGGGGHLTKGAKLNGEELKNRLLDSTEKDLRFYLMKWFEKKGTVEPEEFGNWKIIPEVWYQLAKQRDRALIYGESP